MPGGGAAGGGSRAAGGLQAGSGAAWRSAGAAQRDGRQRGRLKGRWPLEWSQELHCSYSAHGCQTALRAGGFALDYGGSAVAAAGGAWLHVQYCRSKLLLVSRQRGGGQHLRFKLNGRPQPQPKPLACDEHVPGVAVRRCGGVQRACADLNYAATGFARAPRLTVLAGLASGGVGAGGTGHEPLTQKQAEWRQSCARAEIFLSVEEQRLRSDGARMASLSERLAAAAAAENPPHAGIPELWAQDAQLLCLNHVQQLRVCRPESVRHVLALTCSRRHCRRAAHGCSRCSSSSSSPSPLG